MCYGQKPTEPVRRTRIRQIIAFAPLLLALFSPGHAMALGGPYTWEGVVCKASAFVDIEVTLGDFKERKKDRYRVLEVIGNTSERKIKPVDWNLLQGNFTIRGALLRSAPGRSGEDETTYQLLHPIVQKGRYRMRVPVELVDKSGRGWWPIVSAGATLSRINYHDHPSFTLWWSKVGPIWEQKLAAARAGKPFPLCAELNIDGDPTALGKRAERAFSSPRYALPE